MQGLKKQSQATSAETAASAGCRTSSSLVNKRSTIQAELIGINVEDIESSKLVSIVAVDDSEVESIASDGDDKPHSIATKTRLVSFAAVVRLCLSRKSNATEFFSHSLRVALLYYRNQAWKTGWLVTEWTTRMTIAMTTIALVENVVLVTPSQFHRMRYVSV
jgi:hypothetical protein